VTRKTSIKLTPEDDKLIALVKKAYGVTSIMSAIRLALTLAIKKP